MFSIHTKTLIILATITFFAGCTTTSSGPIPAGKDTYVLTRQEGAFPSGDEPLMKEAYLPCLGVVCSHAINVGYVLFSIVD